ncbi:phage tail protein [Schinkia azotoformans]|uniref:phage tail protein n=1 Tax=Schinkia azotoformans TaxID=1454 RepID=UPI002DBD644A|nr:phage tail protein [Schinkia azotoformans]MEC1744111.1 phage tail protein [Schinkia azotoformans]
MAQIGQFGDVIFEVSSNKVLTLDEFSRGGSGRWADHEVIGKKPIPEFVGPGQEEVSFKIQLSAFLGIDPQKELEKLRRIRDKGETRGIILGSDFISKSLWRLESLQESHRVFDGKGRLISVSVDLKIKEYPPVG